MLVVKLANDSDFSLDSIVFFLIMLVKFNFLDGINVSIEFMSGFVYSSSSSFTYFTKFFEVLFVAGLVRK